MPSAHRIFGDKGERIAEKYLVSNRYIILDRNFQRPYGEIDLIAQKGRTLVFCEVKTRGKQETVLFLPEQSVGPKKQQRLRKICETYLREHRYPLSQEWQIDILAVTLDKSDGTARIDHIPNAVFARR